MIFTALLLLSVIGGAFGVSFYALFVIKYVLTAVNAAINAIDYKFFIVGGFTVGAFSTFYYGVLIVESGILNLKKLTKTVVAASCAVACLAGCLFSSVAEYNAVKVYARGTSGISFVVVSCEDTDIMIIADAGYDLPLSTLSAFSSKTETTRFNCVVLLNENLDFSLHRYATKLLYAFDVDEMRYYGNKRENDEFITFKSFPDLTCSATREESFKAGCVEIRYAGGGIGVIATVKGKSVAVLHEFGNTANYGDFPSKEYDFMAACDYADRIYGAFNPKKFATFRANSTFENGEVDGTYCVRL